MESRRNGHCNIVKVVIPKHKDDKDPEVITDQPKIRNDMTGHFQDIFRKQDLDHNTNMLTNCLLKRT